MKIFQKQIGEKYQKHLTFLWTERQRTFAQRRQIQPKTFSLQTRLRNTNNNSQSKKKKKKTVIKEIKWMKDKHWNMNTSSMFAQLIRKD